MFREFSTGGVVYKKVGEMLFWLITRSAPSAQYKDSYWRLPKGWIDDRKEGVPGTYASGIKRASQEILREAALREVAEEGGVDAFIIDKIGTINYVFTFQGKKVQKFVTFFLMEYRGDRVEGFGFETAEIKWVSENTAKTLLKYNHEKLVLEKASAILEKQGSKNT